MLGETLRRARKSKGLTLADLAEKAGVTPGHISQIERNKLEPSLGLLRRLSQALGISFATLFADQHHDGIRVIPAEKAARIEFSNLNLPCRILTAGDKGSSIQHRRLKVLSLDIPPQAWVSPEALTNLADECCFVLEGSLDFYIGEDVHRVGRHDSIYLPCRTSCRIFNPGPQAARMLWAHATGAFAHNVE